MQTAEPQGPRGDVQTTADGCNSKPLLHSSEEEQAAFTTGALAGGASEELSQVPSLTEEAHSPDSEQQGALEVKPAAARASSCQTGCQPSDESASKPAGPQAAMQVHPADVLAHAAEMEPAEGRPGRPGAAQAQAAQATEASGHKAAGQTVMNSTDQDQDIWASDTDDSDSEDEDAADSDEFDSEDEDEGRSDDSDSEDEPAEAEADTIPIRETVHVVLEADQESQLGATHATELLASMADTEAVSTVSHPDELSENLNEGDVDSDTSTDQGTRILDAGTQYDSSEDSWDANSKALFDAVRQGSILGVKRLLEAGCDVTTRDADGRTPLHIAAKGEQLVCDPE